MNGCVCVVILFFLLNNISVVVIFIVIEGIYFKFVDREKSFFWLYQMMEDCVIDDFDEGDGGSLLLCFRKVVILCKFDYFLYESRNLSSVLCVFLNK